MNKNTFILLTSFTGTIAILVLAFTFMFNTMGIMPEILEASKVIAPFVKDYLASKMLYILIAMVVAFGVAKYITSMRCKYCGRFSFSDKCAMCRREGISKPPQKKKSHKREPWAIVLILEIVIYLALIFFVATTCGQGFACNFISIWAAVIFMVAAIMVCAFIPEKNTTKKTRDTSLTYAEEELETMSRKLSEYLRKRL